MTRKIAMGALLVAAVATAAACQSQDQKKDGSKATGSPVAMTEDEKTIYEIGRRIGSQTTILKLTPSEVEALKRGVADAATGKKPEVDPEVYGPKVQPFAQGRMAKAAEANASAAPAEKQKGAAFAEAAAKEPGAVTTPTGIVFRSLSPGTGKVSPVATDTVKVHYRGTFIDGTEFDSSIKRGEPVDFALNGVIPCWTEGLQKMKVGEKARLVCPSSTAYRDEGRPNIPGGATLVFEVELLAIKGK
jgi:FKBP-type peptidyl-prolyl cis-trans isomerase FkpA